MTKAKELLAKAKEELTEYWDDEEANPPTSVFRLINEIEEYLKHHVPKLTDTEIAQALGVADE